MMTMMMMMNLMVILEKMLIFKFLDFLELTMAEAKLATRKRADILKVQESRQKKVNN